jgi:twitching motility protein PilT
MRRHELDYVLRKMLKHEQEVSDLNFTVDKPPQVESFGELVPIELEPPIEQLTPFQTEMIALNLLSGSRRLTEDLLRRGSCDASYAISDSARFRVNIFSQRGNLSVVLRKLNTEIPTLEELRLPAIFQQASKEKTGLILVTGATGSGKTTTLAALLDEINNNRAVHVITLEDPVEYVHSQKKATFNQRELGLDFDNFASGLRAALRQAPKVILVGEMRDRETVEIGLTAAETGHLVLASLHTIDAGQTINRILGMFDTEEQEQVRVRLADTLRWIVSQRLVPRVSGGRTVLLEIMGANLRTKETVQMGESEGKTFYEIIEASYPFGWRTFDNTALEAYENGLISEETALSYCTRRSIVSRGIDNVKKRRGEATSEMVNLRMKVSDDPHKDALPPVPATLKLK